MPLQMCGREDDKLKLFCYFLPLSKRLSMIYYCILPAEETYSWHRSIILGIPELLSADIEMFYCS
jgi:hypothetical protein